MKDKVVIVTGGSGLLGKEMLLQLRVEGAIPINFDVVEATDIDAEFISCDITDDESRSSAVDKVIEKYGRIDGLVNNAYPRTEDWGKPFEEIALESWRTNVDWQLNSYFAITQQVVKQMRLQGSGSIVNIASIYGVLGNDFSIYEGTNINHPAAYSAIKGGLVNFTRYLASLCGKDGIRVNCVSPGGILNGQPDSFVEAYERKVPLKRLGNPQDIAPSVVFLLSEKARYITGHNLMVDGGWSCI